MATKSYRVQHKFWLDLTKGEEDALDETIHELKQNRTFSQTIRDGIRLICDLRAGRLDVLFELFPWVRAEFLEYMQTVQPQQTAGEIALQNRLDSLEKLLLQQGNVPLEPPASGPKALTKVVPSTPPDDDLLVMKKAKSKGDSAKNFLDSAFNLVQ